MFLKYLSLAKKKSILCSLQKKNVFLHFYALMVERPTTEHKKPISSHYVLHMGASDNIYFTKIPKFGALKQAWMNSQVTQSEVATLLWESSGRLVCVVKLLPMTFNKNTANIEINWFFSLLKLLLHQEKRIGAHTVASCNNIYCSKMAFIVLPFGSFFLWV